MATSLGINCMFMSARNKVFSFPVWVCENNHMKEINAFHAVTTSKDIGPGKGVGASIPVPLGGKRWGGGVSTPVALGGKRWEGGGKRPSSPRGGGGGGRERRWGGAPQYPWGGGEAP